MKVDSPANSNIAALEPETATAAQSPEGSGQALRPESAARPGEALAALSASASPLAAVLGDTNAISTADARRIDAAMQTIIGNPEKLLGLLNDSWAATANLIALEAGAV